MASSVHIDTLVRDGAAFADAAEAAGLTAPVASCPGWVMADLVGHLTWVHELFATVVADRVTKLERRPSAGRAADDVLIATYRAGLDALVAALRATPPDTEVWTFTSDHSVRWIARRMAHETAVHRWDAEQAAGIDQGIDATLASDGIDEYVTWFVHRPADGAAPVGGSVHIHCGDVPGEWTLRPAADGAGFDVAREHAKGDCALRGPANDLLLALWRRLPIDAIDVVGDTAVAERFINASATR